MLRKKSKSGRTIESNIPKCRFLHNLLFLCTLSSPVVNAYNLANKRILVTGASGGIGAGIAKTLAERGARVLVHYNTRRQGAELTAQSIRDCGIGVCDGIIQCDFTDPNNIIEMFQNLDEVWGKDCGPDVLVNNAGVISKLAAEDDDQCLNTWMETMQVNLNAPYHLSKLSHERLKRRQGKKSREEESEMVIINVSSIHGSSSVEWMTAYAASKAGLDRLTAGLASEWAPDNVRVNAVAPGVVPVERTKASFDKKEIQDMWLPHLPVKKFGTVEEVAHSVVYLCESEWTTGTILTIDGGMTGRANMPFRPKPEKQK